MDTQRLEANLRKDLDQIAAALQQLETRLQRLEHQATLTHDNTDAIRQLKGTVGYVTQQVANLEERTPGTTTPD